MPRKPSIWFRESDGYYYTTYRRRQHRLAKDPAEAEVAFHRRLAEKLSEPAGAENVAGTKTAFAVIATAFLDRSLKVNTLDTYCYHRQFLRIRSSITSRFFRPREALDSSTWADGRRTGSSCSL
jgi:hypothetical protein